MEKQVEERFIKIRQKKARRSIISAVLIFIATIILAIWQVYYPELAAQYKTLITVILLGFTISVFFILINFVKSEEDDYIKAHNETTK